MSISIRYNELGRKLYKFTKMYKKTSKFLNDICICDITVV